MKIKILNIFFVILPFLTFAQQDAIYLTQNGSIYFKSDAPLELIEANSNALKGAIDPRKNTFAFTVSIASFEGFNSPLQKEHFNENYLESNEFKTASFSGKIIEKTDLTKDGTYSVRAKGELKVHGVKQERIIKSTVTVKDGKLFLESSFSVLLKEHNIPVPKIVYQKIAEEIQVEVKAGFTFSAP